MKLSKSERSIAARASKSTGDLFESWVERHLDEALRLGLITHWVHNEPHGKVIGGKWQMVAAGVADYTAVAYGGQVVAIEAKKRAGRLKKSEVSVEQRRHLDAVVRAGGVALLLVRLVDAAGRSLGEYCCPWQFVQWTVVRSAESVGEGELERWRVESRARCFLEPYCTVRGEPVAAGRRVFPRE